MLSEYLPEIFAALLTLLYILGILAAVVIPQFNNVTVETREAALTTDLRALRNAIGIDL